MGRLYDAFVEVGPKFTGFGEIKKEGDKAGSAYGKALGEAAAKAAQANVKKLGDALGKARNAEADAAGKVRVAEAKLAEVRGNSKAKTSQVTAAEEALAAAERKAAAAATTAKDATQSLERARDRVSKTAEVSGSTSGGRFSKAFKGSLSKLGGDNEGKMFATRFGVGMNGAIGGIVSKSAGIFAAGFAAVKGAQLFVGFIKDAADSARVSRLTAAAIKSTGGAAKVTAGQVGDLATAISNKTGADDETIQSGSNLLLTFTNIRNEVGKGNDIFNQASQSVTDMAAALNGGEVTTNGVKSASIQLGKALNDPIKGVTALSKVGVSFTADQKKQIKTLVESGKTMQAQKVILGELNKEFGGAAAAAGDPFVRLKTIFGNLGEELGGHLLPYAEKFANFVSDKLIPGISGLTSLILKGDFTSAFRKAFNVEEDSGFVSFLLNARATALSVFKEIKGGIVAFGAAWKANDGDVTSSGFPGFMERLAFVAHQAFDYFKSDVLPVLKDLASWIRDQVVPALVRFGGYLTDTLIPVIKRVVVDGFNGFKAGIDNVKQAFQDNKPQLETFVAKVGEIVSWVADKLGPVLGWLAGTQMKLVYGQIANVITGIGKFVDAIKWVTLTAQDMGTKIANVWSAMGAAVGSSWDAIKTASRDALRYVVDNFLAFGQDIIDGAAAAFGWVPGIGDKLKGAKVAFQKFRDSVNNSLSGISDEPVNIEIKYSSNGVNLTAPSSVGRKADGGPIDGPGTTTNDGAGLFRLSRKEWVVKAASAMKYGDKTMASVNDGTATIIPGFARGGSPGLDVRPNFGNTKALQHAVAGHVSAMISATGTKLAKDGGGLGGAMAFGKSQAGKPYVWGASGPNGYDCSGFVSALINFAKGRNPYSRLGATGSMPWSDMASGNGRFEVGWFNGNPGHTAATINGVNYESRGGRGVVYGGSARGAYDRLFTNHAKVKGFAKGGSPKAGDAPFDLLDPRGKNFSSKYRQALGFNAKPLLFDNAGMLPTGRSVVENRTGKPEPLARTDQLMELGPKTITALAQALAGLSINIDGRSLDTTLSSTALQRGY